MSNRLRCLVVGIPTATFTDGTMRPDEASVITFDQLAPRLPLPDTLELVVAPLFCSEFDALEIIEALGAGGYRGTLRVMSPKLPNRQIVLRELRGHAVRQGITLELMEQP
jgi:hypothetical protein